MKIVVNENLYNKNGHKIQTNKSLNEHPEQISFLLY